MADDRMNWSHLSKISLRRFHCAMSRRQMLRRRGRARLHWKAIMRSVASLLACFALAATAQIIAAQAPASPAAGPEARAARAYQTAVQSGPLTVNAFLADFPKGADLHVHLSG